MIALLSMKDYSIRITVSNTMITEALSKAILEAVSTKSNLRVLKRMVRRIVNTAELSCTNFSLVHLPHYISIISKTIIRPAAVF